jgi:hypothetical protein
MTDLDELPFVCEDARWTSGLIEPSLLMTSLIFKDAISPTLIPDQCVM